MFWLGAVWVEKRVSYTPPSELGGDPGFSAALLTKAWQLWSK